MHRNRETVIERLITSEQAYTESLELVMKVFLQPLRKDAKQSTFNFLGMKKMVCTEREFRWLFGNFEEIVELHRTILSSLQERYVALFCVYLLLFFLKKKKNVKKNILKKITNLGPYSNYI
jgi:hypothetical protein